MNAVEIEEAVTELTQQPYEPVAFITGFMAAYGASATTITRLKGGDGNTSDLLNGILWKKWVHFQPAAEGQAASVLDAIEASRKTAQGKVRYAITTDGTEFAARDLKTGEALFCPLPDLENHFGFFLPIAGIDRYEVADENPVDIKATGRLAKLYDALIASNPDWATDARRHDMNQFMTRVIFCLFAEDTGIFRDNIFSETLATRCSAHPENIAATLETMFEVMNLNDKDGSRDGQPAWACAFPYVNGGLFAGSLKAPEFDWMGWRYLREAGKLDWKVINPDIFGSMIQSIVNTDERGELGMHYTSVPNILKVLNPLFLDGLREEVEAGWDSKAKLQAVLKRLMKIRVFDPACGSGNFLVIAYREMREIEIRVLKRLQEMTGEMAGLWSHVELKNFYGIEIGDFAAETAKLALWIAQHQMNKRFEGEFGRVPVELPLRDGGQIICRNALRVEWRDFCPSLEDEDVITYIAGNPPYLGAKKRSNEQSEDMILCGMSDIMIVDYVGAWFVKASNYADSINSHYAFVATSSICQGEQVSLLWGRVLDKANEISFCYEPFKWENNAANNAGVYCTIVGIRKIKSNNYPKKIFSNGYYKKVSSISPYLIEGEFVVIESSGKALNGMPEMCMGSNPVDGKNLIVENFEYHREIIDHPTSAKFYRKYMGGNDFMKSVERYCLWIKDDEINEAQQYDFIRNRLESCRNYRLSAGRDAKKSANRSHSFCYNTKKDFPAIICPNTSSSSRKYIPIDFIDRDVVVNHAAFVIYNGTPQIFSILSSTMHRVWLAAAGGRLGDGFRYSVRLVYNTFPVPKIDASDFSNLARNAESIMMAREAHFPSTLFELYDPDEMPSDLADAHRVNDEVVEKMYIGRTFKNDTERLEHLFKLYTKMVASKGRA